ncbi:nicotinate-nucleotide adenylyltransferase [Kozakia baliensis]|uniref:nicotinate-nucleotide adenylyltransferase n=1 Tax=Kozakia baliensis TaxID=153496 RepID=UPI000A73F20F|nr:nicotinate-nucleotide adenylyltransferase [Kozakia baliensis]GBR33708.1 nicotinic acid mononucleotide adenylyltransferase [Kozakia baliensis NRIC 0488]GEL64873.1 putative nicotinate-nucleotide adenylyltransferase [Kozakia baliensis]
MSIPTYGDQRNVAIGLLGGSFNPAHPGHLQLARYALRHLKLDQVWLMVSPGNPLKARAGMAPFVDRLASARMIADGRRIIATDIESRLHRRYTVETVALLRQRFPRARFVWLMGADGLASFTRWRRWRKLAHLVPIVVVPRPGSNVPALTGKAAHVLGHFRQPACRAPILKFYKGNAWTFLPAPQNGISATALRDLGQYPAAASS